MLDKNHTHSNTKQTRKTMRVNEASGWKGVKMWAIRLSNCQLKWSPPQQSGTLTQSSLRVKSVKPHPTPTIPTPMSMTATKKNKKKKKKNPHLSFSWTRQGRRMLRRGVAGWKGQRSNVRNRADVVGGGWGEGVLSIDMYGCLRCRRSAWCQVWGCVWELEFELSPRPGRAGLGWGL